MQFFYFKQGSIIVNEIFSKKEQKIRLKSCFTILCCLCDFFVYKPASKNQTKER